jgi:WD40 repeat protein
MKSSIQDLFICKYEGCNKYYKEPIILECGRSICKEHLEDVLKGKKHASAEYYECKMCAKRHDIPKYGFIFNNDINDVIETNGHLNEKEKELKTNIHYLEENVNKFNGIEQDPDGYLNDFINNLRTKINLQQTSLKNQIDEIHFEMIEEIDKLELECKLNINLNKLVVSNDTNKICKEKLIKYNRILRVPLKQDSELIELLNDLNETNELCSKNLFDLKNKIQNNKKCEFIPNLTKLCVSEFGDFIYQIEIEPVDLVELRGHTGCVNSAIYWTENRIISCSDDKTVKIWSLSTGECLSTLSGHLDWIYCLLLLSDKSLASGCEDGSIKIWDLETKKCVNTIEVRQNSVLSLCSLGECNFASGHQEGDIKIWSLITNECLRTLDRYSYDVRCIKTFKNFLFCCAADPRIFRWDLNNKSSNNFESIFKGHTDEINWLETTSNGLLISCSDDTTVKIWDINDCFCIQTFKDEHPLTKLILLNDADLIVNSNGNIKFWTLSKRNGIKKVFKREISSCLVVLPNENLITFMGDRKTLMVQKNINISNF